MKKTLLFLALASTTCIAIFAFHTKPIPITVSENDNDSTVFKKIFDDVLLNGQAYENLRVLCERAPKRLSGSVGAQKSVDVTYNMMQGMGLDSVWLQECMVPHWERGAREQGEYYVREVTTPFRARICALGGSVATPPQGLKAEVIEVKDFDELKKLGKKNVEGKIVFFNHPFDETKVSTFHAYGEAVGYRWAGPHLAETYGAVGVIVRSMSNAIDTFPHTGVMRSDSLKATIPSAAIATADAETMSMLIQAGNKVQFNMKMNCQWFPDEKSYNVIGEIRGSTNPKDVIVFGGHLDAWDNGNGAHDDGAGCMQAVEVLRIFKALKIKPKNTIRCVLWMNEENGGRGGAAYAKYSADTKIRHVAAIESDAGGFTPHGFGLDMSPEQKAKIRAWQPLFLPYGVYDFMQGGGGADIEDLKEQGTPLIGLLPDSQRYFNYHHTEDDVFENVNRRELHLGAGAMASLVFMIDKYGL